MRARSSSSMTVADALELPALRRGLPEVVAGASELGRPIRWVHAGEVSNMASLLRGGELLLITGMGIGPRAEDQRRFVEELAARGVAAVVVELGGTYARRLPPALVAAAERHGLPLVELHAAVPYVAVTEEIHTAIVNGHHDVLQRADALHERFTALMLEGGGVPGVLSLLAEALGNPVFLEAADGRLLFSASPTRPAVEGDPVRAWTQAAADAETIGLTAQVPAGAGRAAGRLVCLPLAAPLDAFGALAVERAAAIVALAFLRTRQEEELLALGRGDLLSRLADGRLEPGAAAARARAMGFADRDARALVPVVARAAGATAARPWEATLRDLERELAALGTAVLVGLDPSDADVLLLIGVRDPADRDAVVDRAAAVVGAAARRHAGVDAVVAAGGAGSWSEAPAGLRDAAEAAAAAARLPPRTWHDATAMPLERLLWRLREHPEVRAFADRVLGPVLAHDAERKHALLPTLEALCAHGGRKAETARALHLNRQALYDRLARLETLLGRDVDDPQVLLTMQVALAARRHAAG